MKEIKVYQKSFALAMEIFEITKAFTKAETYSLIDQVRRSSRSVVLVWQKRIERKFILHILLQKFQMRIWKIPKRLSG